LGPRCRTFPLQCIAPDGRRIMDGRIRPEFMCRLPFTSEILARLWKSPTRSDLSIGSRAVAVTGLPPALVALAASSVMTLGSVSLLGRISLLLAVFSAANAFAAVEHPNGLQDHISGGVEPARWRRRLQTVRAGLVEIAMVALRPAEPGAAREGAEARSGRAAGSKARRTPRRCDHGISRPQTAGAAAARARHAPRRLAICRFETKRRIDRPILQPVPSRLHGDVSKPPPGLCRPSKTHHK